MLSTAGASILAACAPGAPVAPAAPTSSSAPSATPAAGGSASISTPAAAKPSGQPKSGGVGRHAISADVATLDGHTRTGSSVDTNWLIYDRLTAYDSNLKPGPMLAESWELSSDYKQIKFNLRKGVQWHNGRELTSDDVKYNVLRVRDPKLGFAQFAAQSKWFTSIETPDKYTIVLTSDQSRPAMFDFWENFNMLDKDTMEGPDVKTKAVGTGPWVFSEWAQGDHWTFSKNKNYWQSGRPYLDGLIVNIRDQQTAMTQLEAGALDAVKTPPVVDISRLKSDPKYVNVVHPNPGTFFLFGLNLAKPPLDNKMVRQALNYAINRKRLVEQIYDGTAIAQALPWSPSSPGYDQAKNGSYAFDLDKAKSLLKDAGVSSFEVDNVIISGNFPLLENFLQVYQADLATLGVRMNIQPVAAAVWVDQVNNSKFNGMYASNDNNANVQPSTLLNVSAAWFGGLPNNSNLNDDTWKHVVDAVSVETDPAKQKMLFAQMNDLILDLSWNLPVSNYPQYYLTQSVYKGLSFSMHAGGFVFTDAWLDQ
jgi:peptide/nickel transport system substrate-binding protein